MKITTKLRKKVDNFDALKRRIRKIQNEKVFYGYFAEQGDHSKWNISYAELMAINEFGNEADGIPPRPVFTITIKSKANYYPVIKSALSKYFYKLDSSFNPEQPLSDIGYGLAMKTASNFGDTTQLEPNADWTIQEKGKDEPLVWTGELQANIAYKTTLSNNLQLVF